MEHASVAILAQAILAHSFMIGCYGLGASTFAAGRPATTAELQCLRSHIPESRLGIEDETGTDYILPHGTQVEIRSNVAEPCCTC